MGWTGYATDPLQERRSALSAALITGAVWAAGQALSTVTLRVLIVWLYNNTHKSVFAATLFHGMTNVAGSSFPNFGSHYDPVVTGAIAAAVAAVVVAAWGPATLARRS